MKTSIISYLRIFYLLYNQDTIDRLFIQNSIHIPICYKIASNDQIVYVCRSNRIWIRAASSRRTTVRSDRVVSTRDLGLLVHRSTVRLPTSNSIVVSGRDQSQLRICSFIMFIILISINTNYIAIVSFQVVILALFRVSGQGFIWL